MYAESDLPPENLLAKEVSAQFSTKRYETVYYLIC